VWLLNCKALVKNEVAVCHMGVNYCQLLCEKINYLLRLDCLIVTVLIRDSSLFR
jgi:hypothetical protein